MSLPDPVVRDLARRLLAREAGTESPGTLALAGAAERAFDKLRLHLSRLLGTDGFRVLLARAVTLARAEYSWLESARVRDDGSLEGLAEAAVTDTAEAREGITAVPAQFLGLLETFIGRDLTLRLLHGVWPEADLPRDAGGEEPTR